MATKAKCLALAATLDATITDSGTTLGLEAPARHLVDADQHEFIYDVMDGRAGVWSAIWSDLRRFERDGFDLCTNAECDWCNE
jgi:hypothetical protein